jgi:hypothetical protein
MLATYLFMRFTEKFRKYKDVVSGSNYLKRFLKYIHKVITSCKLHSVGATLYAGWSILHLLGQEILMFSNVRVFSIEAFVPSCSKHLESTSNNSI